MKRSVFIILLMLTAHCGHAQLNPSQKLYQLCKVWGYLKYYHPNNCAIKWNDLLLEKVDSVVASGNDASFHEILYRMCLQTGVTSQPVSPTVILGDTARNYNTDWFNDPQFANPVRLFLDSVAAHRISNSSGCLLRLNNYLDPNYTPYIDFRRDSINNVPGFSYTNMKHRMLVYFYYWNTIKYLAPQISIADNSWDSTLLNFMPEMIAANTDSAFELTLSKVVSRTDDSHGFFSSKYYTKYLTGVDYTTQLIYYAKLQIARIENKNVVTASGEPNISRGDIITKIDGIDADTFLNRWKPYFAASNEMVKFRSVYSNLTDGVNGSVRHLEITDGSSNQRQVDLHLTSSYSQYNNWFNNSVDTLPTWTISKCGYGYVNMGKLTHANVNVMYAALKNTPAIIFDIRNYPQGTLWDLKPLLFGSPTVSARYFAPDLYSPGYYFSEDDFSNFGSWNNSSPYSGRVIVLVNEQTQSQAEYTAQVLGTLPNAVIIGSQTAGADGNVTYLDLPNIRTHWTSLGWFEHDWYNPQRAGIRIDSVVRPTIAGIRQGKDEVLNKAFDCPLDVHETSKKPAFIVTQDSREITVKSNGDAMFGVQLINLAGQQVFKKQDCHHTEVVNAGDLPPGIYIIVVSDDKGSYKKMKIDIF